MTIIARILLSLPIAIGLGLILSTSGKLLDAYQASEQYREHVSPIVDTVIDTGQAPDLTVDERFELRMGLPRAQMDRGSFESLRLCFYGGLLLFMVGSLIAWRADSKKRLGAAGASRQEIAEQDGTGQPATRPESNTEGSGKPQPESEGRSR